MCGGCETAASPWVRQEDTRPLVSCRHGKASAPNTAPSTLKSVNCGRTDPLLMMTMMMTMGWMVGYGYLGTDLVFCFVFFHGEGLGTKLIHSRRMSYDRTW